MVGSGSGSQCAQRKEKHGRGDVKEHSTRYMRLHAPIISLEVVRDSPKKEPGPLAKRQSLLTLFLREACAAPLFLLGRLPRHARL